MDDRVWQEILEFKRSGVTLIEFWKFILNSPKREKVWMEYIPQGKLDLKMWRTFLENPKRRNLLYNWINKNSDRDTTNTTWWDIVLSSQSWNLSSFLSSEYHCFSKEPEVFLPLLMQILENKNRTCRIELQETCLDIISKMGNEGGRSSSLLIQKLKHRNKDIIAKAAYALGEIKGEPEKAIPALIKALQKEPLEFRNFVEMNIICTLGKFGSLAVKACPLIEERLANQDLFQTFRKRYEVALMLIKTESSVKDIVL